MSVLTDFDSDDSIKGPDCTCGDSLSSCGQTDLKETLSVC